MKIPQCRVEWTPAGGSAQNINILSVRSNYGIETTKDTFQLSFIDSNNTYNLDLNDRIKIYFNYIGDSEVLVMDGLVQSIGPKADEKNNKKTIKGSNIFEVFFTFHAFARSDNPTNPRCNEILQNLIEEANDTNSIIDASRQITWHPSNPNTNSSGGAFPDIQYDTGPKPLSEHIEALSTNEYTGDGQYIYYLDTGNNLVWKPRPQQITGSIDYGSNTISISRNKTNDDTLNFYIINCGNDISSIEGGKPAGSSIHAWKINETSIGKHGARHKYAIWKDISDNMYVEGKNTGSNSDFRDACEDAARKKANAEMNKASGGKEKLTINIPGSTAYVPGDKFKISMPHSGWTTDSRKELRLMEIEHNFDKTGWWTTLNFEEDII